MPRPLSKRYDIATQADLDELAQMVRRFVDEQEVKLTVFREEQAKTLNDTVESFQKGTRDFGADVNRRFDNTWRWINKHDADVFNRSWAGRKARLRRWWRDLTTMLRRIATRQVERD